jgi:hypothetical protein
MALQTAGRACVVALLLAGCGMPSAAQDLEFSAVPSACLPVGPGPEDFAVLEAADGSIRLFASVKTRRLWRKESDDGTIVEVALGRDGQLTGGPTPLWPPRAEVAGDAGPEDADRLQPVGVSLTEIGGRERLYMIDTDGDGGSLIRDLDVTEPGVARDGGPIMLEPPAGIDAEDLLPSPNGILALPDGHIYVSNPVTPQSPAAWLRYHQGEWPSLVHIGPPDANRRRPTDVVAEAAEISFANGIAADPGRQRIFVADYTGQRVVVFKRDPGNGALDGSYSIPIDGLPDNLMTDGKTLYVAAQRSRIRTFCNLVAPGLCGSPSRAYAIDLADIETRGVDARPRLLWDDGGAYVEAGSTAYRLGDELLVSQIVADGIYIFDRDNGGLGGASAAASDCRPQQ